MATPAFNKPKAANSLKAALQSALKAALEPMVTKAELHSALKPMVSREHRQRDLALVQQRMTIRPGGLPVVGEKGTPTFQVRKGHLLSK